MVLHELIEFEELQGQPGKCLQALKKELAHAYDTKRQNICEYVTFRLEMFKNLVEYLEKNEKDPPILLETRNSLNYLELLTGQDNLPSD